MVKATPKIVLSGARDIPLDLIDLSQSNVRRVKAGVSIEALADDIARRGLLHSLNLRPTLDDEGQETGRFHLPARSEEHTAELQSPMRISYAVFRLQKKTHP